MLHRNYFQRTLY